MARRLILASLALLAALGAARAYNEPAQIAPGTSLSGATTLGTGAASSATLANRATDYGATFNLKTDFGAKCDGATDDTAAIQAWLNMATAGVRLVAPAGTCLFSSLLAAPTASNYAISGAGVGATTFRYTGAATASNLVTLGTGAETGVVIADFSVTSVNAATGALLQWDGAAFTPNSAGQRTIVNVLAFGADPTGQSDSTSAFRAAVAAGTNFNTASDGYHPRPCLYVPAGNYTITDAITLPVLNGCMFGDGRELSTLNVSSSTFNLSASGVVILPNSNGATAPELHDFGVNFVQPNATARAGIVAFPPAVYARDASRALVRNLRIQGGSYCIDARGNAGGSIFDNIECGSLVVGLMLGSNPANPTGDPGALDGVHVHGWHFWDFGVIGQNAGLTSIFSDGTNISMQIGRVDWLTVTDSQNFLGNIVYLNEAQNSADQHQWTNVSLDSASWIQQGGVVYVANLQNATGGTGPQGLGWPAVINVSTNGNTHLYVKNANLSGYQGSGNLVNVSAGSVDIDSGTLTCGNTAYSCAAVSGGGLYIRNMDLAPGGSAAWTVPFIAQSGSGSLKFDGNRFINAGAGIGVGFASDSAAWNFFSPLTNQMAGWTYTIPATITNANNFYGNNVTLSAPSGPMQFNLTDSDGSNYAAINLNVVGKGTALFGENNSGQAVVNVGSATVFAGYPGGAVSFGTTGTTSAANGSLSIGANAAVGGSITAAGNLSAAGGALTVATGGNAMIGEGSGSSLSLNGRAIVSYGTSLAQRTVALLTSLGCTASNKGDLYTVTDLAAVPTYYATMGTGGGSYTSLEQCDGANWRNH